MTVPLADGANARKITYKYDVGGRQNGMSVDTILYTSFRGRSSATGDGKTHFVYNENDNRVKLTTVYGNEYYFVYDPTASIPAVVYEEGPDCRYVNVREPDGGLISREKWRDGTRLNAYTYHFDGLGSTVALTDAYGAITDRYSYDEWGNVTHTAFAGSVSDNPYQYVGRYGYYTHYQEPNIKLLQLGVRFYDPAAGKFTQKDPFIYTQSPSRYAYSDDQPLLKIDPEGLQCYYDGSLPFPYGDPGGIFHSVFGGYVDDPTPVMKQYAEEKIVNPVCHATREFGGDLLLEAKCTAICTPAAAVVAANSCAWAVTTGTAQWCLGIVGGGVFAACMYRCMSDGIDAIQDNLMKSGVYGPSAPNFTDRPPKPGAPPVGKIPPWMKVPRIPKLNIPRTPIISPVH